MLPELIVNFAASVSISLAFLEPPHFNLQIAQTMQEERLACFDRIIVACRLLLETCGRTTYLSSIFNLWSQTSQALYILERQLWPEQPAETSLQLNCPNEGRPLTEILVSPSDQFPDGIINAIPALDAFTTWFTANYDTNLHAEYYAVLTDSMLLLRTAETLLRMKRRFGTLDAPLTAPDPVVADVPATSPAPTAASATPAIEDSTNDVAASSSTGTILTWY